MVQIHENGGFVDHDMQWTCNGSHWWKLQKCSVKKKNDSTATHARSFLDEHKFEFNRRTTEPERLEYLYTRAARGMVSYYRCTVAELRKFCKQRNIPNAITQGRKKEELVDILERADEDAKFEKFLDLPPELRLLVYDYSLEIRPRMKYLENWRDAVFELHPPPVASVCKLLRQESLSPFYAPGELQLTILYNVDRSSSRFNSFQAGRDTTKFFAEAPDMLLESVGKMNVEVRAIYKDLYRHDETEWKVTLSTSSAPYQISLLPADPALRYPPRQDAAATDRTHLDKCLRKFLDDLTARAQGERAKLQRTDMDLLMKIFQDSSEE